MNSDALEERETLLRDEVALDKIMTDERLRRQKQNGTLTL